jgi:hypothetical protein
MLCAAVFGNRALSVFFEFAVTNYRPMSRVISRVLSCPQARKPTRADDWRLAGALGVMWPHPYSSLLPVQFPVVFHMQKIPESRLPVIPLKLNVPKGPSIVVEDQNGCEPQRSGIPA